ncbi:MAG: chorismate synthase [Clostridium sp.]
MSATWGNNLKLTIFGESHGVAIGGIIEGIPSGTELDLEFINKEMGRRAPGHNNLSTPRKESDQVEILSGFFQEKTTGTPLSFMIKNTNKNSKDYSEVRNIMRPGHGDYTGNIKYFGFNDYRGGGHFSGRITAPLVFAGAIAKQILEAKGIFIGAHVKSIYDINDESFNSLGISADSLLSLKNQKLPVLNKGIGEKMEEAIIKAREDGDSVGGVIELMVLNPLEGLGMPFFDSVESRLAQILFSVPAVKGIEFGAGFHIASMRGSEANDSYIIKEGNIKTTSNNNGGILGGITSGMPIIFKVAIKPTPSISKLQSTIDIKNKVERTLEVKGRHDPCIVPRAIPVIEAVTALTILDLLLDRIKEVNC